MQGRFKRDGSASAEPESHGGTDRGSSPQHAQSQGPAPSGDGGERGGRTGASAPPNSPVPPGTVTPDTPTPTVEPGKGPTGTGSRLALRNWRISTRLVSLLALPVVAATTLGALRINESMDDIQQLDNMKLLTQMTKQATELAAALQEERDQSAGPLAHGGLKSTDYTVKGYQEKTDHARDNFLTASEQIDTASKNGNLQGVRDALVGIVHQLDDLAKIRKNAYQSKNNATQTVESYHRLITQLIGLSQDMAEASSNPEMISRTRALAAFSTAKEYASVQRAMIAAALPATTSSKGHLSKNDQLYGEAAYESEASELAIFRKIYADQNAEALLKPIEEGNPTIKAANTYAKRAFASPDGIESLPARSYRDWLDTSVTKIQQMKNIEHSLLEDMEQKARELKASSEQDAIISGALILIVLGISLVGAFVVARSMIRSLRRLQETATKVAQDRLPELVKQLSESDPQDVDTSVESVGVHSRDEIGQVAAAFDDVHREAVRLAAEQALLRGNVNAMFTNLSRRSQGLIQRQLSLISELESREADPDQLSSLFKLDHLATRMRRNGENLLVLAGEEPGRRWTRPVPLVDVLRAAASEVEQYERIELASVPTTEVAGRVVNDLVHLLAELLENATSFSSPQTKVKVTGHALPDGRVLIEIHDTGIGLSPEDLAAINERLASPPTVDVSVSRRMGLFVVGRLSQRHGIRIQLRPSDSGGTTALVMLPVDVAQGGKKPGQGKPGAPAPTGGPAAAQAAAGAAAARRASTGNGQGGGPLGAGSGPRGQVGAGQGPRAALPGAGQGGRPGAPGGARGPQGGPGSSQQNRPPAGTGAGGFGSPAPNAQQGLPTTHPGGQQDFFGGRGSQRTGGPAELGRQPQLPPRGGARAELPGGEAQSRTADWGGSQAPLPRAAQDAPRGHEEQDPAHTAPMPRVDDRQGPGSTADIPRIDDVPAATGEFPHADFNGFNDSQNTGQFAHPDNSQSGEFARPDGSQHTGQFAQPDAGQQTGQFAQPDAAHQDDRFGPRPDDRQGSGPFVRSDVFGQSVPEQQNDPQQTGQFEAQQAYRDSFNGGFDGSSTGRHALPGRQEPAQTGQFERPQPAGRNDFGAPRQPAPQQRTAGQEPGGRSVARRPGEGRGPSDGRTPLYDTLETNWFHGGAQQESAPAAQQPQAPAPAPQPSASNTGSWRTSPNDDLVRQAERVRQPSAGGVTTSGLPRRVPRANLVPGTAQQQQHQAGPQVSRAPDDVRGRLTNLRRGIAQGRQAGNGQTGSFPSPTHQQER
ncbi:nitrate- and nitrite sensing domain-containing protein [Streptomyces sp. MUM 16J]|uniref:sensor histidine kinase n=1 Tax=Streptomyces sp. MUM 16J TaxID=2791988 RepID=UPI001F03E05E|nr:nitrate- and nitrite sensing domain-containing protein [Streptomyces sp. MUM 16J]MCH0559509.1 nitrate- and nitrite sensing domain-containing protein [Streptomyces sp. MUM 16J]